MEAPINNTEKSITDIIRRCWQRGWLLGGLSFRLDQTKEAFGAVHQGDIVSVAFEI
jgi:hypothetical protein